MGYSDQKYYDRGPTILPGIVFGTATASGTNTLASPVSPLIPVYIRKTTLKGFSIVPTTVASAAIVAGTFVILNGTATAGQCSVVGAIGTAINGTVTASNATVGTNTGFTYELILSTSTASGGVTGTFCLELETNEQYNAAV
jgi:hypothetical protein